MQDSNKIKSYIGFSIKSGQIIFGSDNLLTTQKHIKLIVLCSTLAKASEEKVVEFAAKKEIPILKLDNLILEDIVYKKNCKVVGLTNKNLARATMMSVQNWVISPKGGDI